MSTEPSTSPRPPLPAHWIAEIFRRMQGLYGSLWVERWRSGEVAQGMDTGVANAMSVWAEELAGFADQPARIKQALQACRSRALPPTLPEFLELCRQAASPTQQALPAPTLTPEQIAQRKAVADAAAKRMAAQPKNDGLLWAKRLRVQYLRGDTLHEVSIRAASEVLGEVWRERTCVPAVLPQQEAA